MLRRGRLVAGIAPDDGRRAGLRRNTRGSIRDDGMNIKAKVGGG